MKKYFLNPYDVFLGIFILLLLGIELILCVVFTIIDITKSPTHNGSIIVLILLYLLPISFGVYFAHYLYKYSGYLYWKNDVFTLKKGRRKLQFNVSDIRWIELQHDLRGASARVITSRRRWKFSIRLHGKKENLNFIITNNIIIDIIQKYQIRIMPDEYNKAYLNGTMDLKKYK